VNCSLRKAEGQKAPSCNCNPGSTRTLGAAAGTTRWPLSESHDSDSSDSDDELGIQALEQTLLEQPLDNVSKRPGRGLLASPCSGSSRRAIFSLTCYCKIPHRPLLEKKLPFVSHFCFFHFYIEVSLTRT
jgi:hypothetical protein